MAAFIYLREAIICICWSNYHLMLINNGMTLGLISNFLKKSVDSLCGCKKQNKTGPRFHACLSDVWHVCFYFNICGLQTTFILDFQTCSGKYTLKVWEISPLILFLF